MGGASALGPPQRGMSGPLASLTGLVLAIISAILNANIGEPLLIARAEMKSPGSVSRVEFASSLRAEPERS